MKKVVIFILFSFLLLGCRKIVREDFPQPIMGTLPNGLTIAQAENIITDACYRGKWRITNRAEGWMKIALFKKEYDFYGSITYNENNYTISMDNVVSPDRVKDDARRSKLFSGYATKLARLIQKQGQKSDVLTQKYNAHSQQGMGNSAPIIINNNIAR